jgi:hypothetical protein
MDSRLLSPLLTALITTAVFTMTSSMAASQTSMESAFPYAYETNVQLDDLSDGSVVGLRVPSQGRGLSMSVESYYLLPDSPKDVVKLMIDSTSATGAEASDTLSIEGHYIISHPPQSNDFSPFTLEGEKSSRFGFGGTRMLEAEVDKLNLDTSEAKQLEQAAQGGQAAIDKAWEAIFLNRARTFHQGGLMKNSPYQTRDKPFDVRQELVAMLKSRPKILGRFQDLLGVVMTGQPIEGMLKPSHYWQNHQLQGQRVVTMAYITARAHKTGYQVVDCTYYVTGGYYTSLILYELQPVTVDGKEQTLVWRGDYVISESINFLKGVERMAAEKIMLLEIKKSVESFIDEVRRKN